MIFSLNLSIYAQSLTGLSGYFKIPSAYISEDAQLSIGGSIFNKRYQQYSGYQKDDAAAYILIGYLPRLELSLRITRAIGAYSPSSNFDRMISGKLLIVEEGEYVPAFSLGLQNPFSTEESANHFNSTYFVVSKLFQLSSILNTSFTVGRGFDWIKAADYEFIGFFGGAEIKISPIENLNMSLIFENTGLVSNIALKFIIFKHFVLLAGFEGLNALSIGSAIKINL
jgi:hypothetical protein